MPELKQRFVILWIEDKSSVVKLNEKELQTYFEENHPDFELVVLHAKTKADVSKHFGGNSIDIVVTDYNLQEDWNGIDVIKSIHKKKSLTDVFFYTAAKFDFKIDDLYKKTKHYGFIEVSEGSKEIHEKVVELVEKNLKRCQDIIFLRGLVISNVINIELKINQCLAHYFKIGPERTAQFHNYILENRYNSFAGKKKTIGKILKNHNLESDFTGLMKSIDEIEESRNLLAHCKVDEEDRNVLISMGDEERFDKKRVAKILDRIRGVDDHADTFIEKMKSLK